MALSEDVAKKLSQLNALSVELDQRFIHHDGTRSPIYVDCRVLFGNVEAREMVVSGLVEAALAGDAQAIVGIESGGIGWGAMVADRLRVPFAYLRKEAKNYGRRRKVEGFLPDGARVWLVDDVLFRGTTAHGCAEFLRSDGNWVAGVLAILDYGLARSFAPVRDTLRVSSLTTIGAVLSAVAAGTQPIPDEDERAVGSFLDNPDAAGLG